MGNTTPQDISNIETSIEAEAQLDALEPIVDHIEFEDSAEITPVAEDTILDPEVSTTIDAKVEEVLKQQIQQTWIPMKTTPRQSLMRLPQTKKQPRWCNIP